MGVALDVLAFAIGMWLGITAVRALRPPPRRARLRASVDGLVILDYDLVGLELMARAHGGHLSCVQVHQGLVEVEVYAA
jgi:hypothetical protein